MRPAFAPGGSGSPDRARSFRVLENNFVETTDLDFASYLYMRGVPVADVVRGSGLMDVTIVFVDVEKRVQSLAIEWLNSESAKFAMAQRSLKKTCRSHSPSR
jgi:hypothetical protein